MNRPEGPLYYMSLAAVICCCLLASAVCAYDLESKTLKYTLKNGLKVILMERHLSPTVSLYIRYGVGAAQDPGGKTGTAHFLEHLLFKGTQSIGTKGQGQETRILKDIFQTGQALDAEKGKGPRADPGRIDLLTKRLASLQGQHRKWFLSNEIDRLYTENGGVHVNASTGQDITSYQVSLPSNKIELWARIESDRMQHPIFREFYEERDVIMEERRQRIESDPGGKLYEQFLAAAFQVHPYRRPILGWPADMASLDPETLKAYFHRYHAPNNTVIAVVGDMDPAQTLKLITRYFGSIPRQEIPPLPPEAEPRQSGERRIEVPFDAAPELIIGYHKPALPDFEDYVFDVIETVLSRGRTSRFYRSLVTERGIAESISTAGVPAARHPNLFAIFAAPRHPHTVATLEDAIYDEIERLKSEPIPPKEMERVRNQLQADFIRGLDGNEGLASRLSYYEILTGDYRYLTRHLKIIETVTPEDIMAVARTYLHRDNRTVAWVSKKEKKP